jgi:ArsR family transcriptional regulator
LALLRARDIVVGRKEGNNIFYSVRDPSLFRILDAAREIFSNQLVDSQEMLSYVREEEQAVGAGRPGAAESG